jgi:hypothetical protein
MKYFLIMSLKYTKTSATKKNARRDRRARYNTTKTVTKYLVH